MSGQCSSKNCFPDTTCALGIPDREKCEHWKQEEAVEDESVEPADVSAGDVPWNAFALGIADLAILGGRGQPLVVGLIGPPNSGKTSLLAYLYMWFLKEGKLGDWDFSGSWTLGAWESLVQPSRWTGAPPPSFPPHTSSSGRHPGVLHVSLRHSKSEKFRDVLFTDGPGEWFTQWARVPGDPTAAGARWVVNHADVLLLLIDSDALADTERLPQTRRATRDLIERVGAEKHRCDVTVVWTKDDIEVPGTTRKALERPCREYLPNASSRRTTITRPETIEQCFAQAIQAGEDVEITIDAVEPRLSADPFLAFRGNHGIA